MEILVEGPTPTVAAVVSTEPTEEQLAETRKLADVIEVRADLLPSHDVNYLLDLRGRIGEFPVIATARASDEGGEWQESEQSRAELYFSLLPHFDAVDVEVTSDIIIDVVEACGEEVPIIGSYHNYEATNTEELEARFDTAMRLDTDFFKAATWVNDLEEYRQLAGFTLRHAGGDIIVVAMDKYGPLSRLALPGLGSLLVYAPSIGSEVMSGQLPLDETRALVDRLYPK